MIRMDISDMAGKLESMGARADAAVRIFAE